MSDHDPDHDSIDQAYGQAEEVLDDAAARAARRARVLGAVAQAAAEPGNELLEPEQPRSRRGWTRGGWLAAAGVAGLGALIAVRLYQPTFMPAPSLAEQTAPAVSAPAPAPSQGAVPEVPAAPPAEQAQTQGLAEGPLTAPAEMGARAPAEAAEAQAMAAPPPALQLAPPPAPVVAPRPAPQEVEVQGGRASMAPSAESRAARVTADEEAQGVVVTGPRAGVRPTRLHAAAAAGRLKELRALLKQGMEVDAPDADGQTALMKAVQAGNAEAVALLRRSGADPDLENAQGLSAREMAARAADPAVRRALEGEP
jgi:hypothetical protein